MYIAFRSGFHKKNAFTKVAFYNLVVLTHVIMCCLKKA